MTEQDSTKHDKTVPGRYKAIIFFIFENKIEFFIFFIVELRTKDCRVVQSILYPVSYSIS
jgi:hypothetical protein